MVLSCHFFIIFHKNPLLSCLYFVEKRLFCENFTILRSKKVNRMPFFPIFREKIAALMPIFHQKYVYSLKNTLKPIICRKNVQSLKNCHLNSFFLKFFMKNHLLASPYLVKRRQFCQNYMIFWIKKVNRYPAFPIFTEK